MDFETIIFEREESVAILSFNRPDKRNAFNTQMVSEINTATELVSNDDSIRCVILTGKGLGFSAGADLTEENSNWKSTEESLIKGFMTSLLNIINMPKPVISAVNGAAAGIGSAYAMACDLTVMGEGSYLLQAFSNIGLVPDGGANWLLVNTVGYKLAYQIAIEGEKIPASRCLELGLTNKVVPDSNLMEETLNWSKRLTERAPQSMRHTKTLMRESLNSTYVDTYSSEAKKQNELFGSPDNKEGIKAFLEKRAPKFNG